MTIILTAEGKHAWVAKGDGLVGRGPGPLAAIRALWAALALRRSSKTNWVAGLVSRSRELLILTNQGGIFQEAVEVWNDGDKYVCARRIDRDRVLPLSSDVDRGEAILKCYTGFAASPVP